MLKKELGVGVFKTRLKAIIWLHILRLGRYKYSFINMIMTSVLWYLLFLLGVLMFIPADELQLYVAITFWGIVLWSMMNNAVWLIAGWVGFTIASGVLEEHVVYDVNPLLLIMGRFITGSIVSLATIPVVAIVLSGFINIDFFVVENVGFLILGVTLILIYATLYALILASLSIRFHVPGVMLDVVNVFMYVVGGIGVPVARMPHVMRYIALVLPYTHAAEIVRYGAVGMEPYIGLVREIIIALLYLLVMAAIVAVLISRVEHYMRTHGVKGVGRM